MNPVTYLAGWKCFLPQRPRKWEKLKQEEEYVAEPTLVLFVLLLEPTLVQEVAMVVVLLAGSQIVCWLTIIVSVIFWAQICVVMYSRGATQWSYLAGGAVLEMILSAVCTAFSANPYRELEFE